MEFKTIGGHTFAPELLSDGVIIDVGCRGFEFAKWFDGNVFCVDPDEKVFPHNCDNETIISAELKKITVLHYIKAAISDKTGETTYYENGESTMIRELDPDPTFVHIDKKYCNTCKTITMDDLYAITGTNVDILKLDCEGAEYLILDEGFKPIPKQITVEFHHHCVPETHKQHYTGIIERLSKDYEMLNDVWEQRHGCGFNFWDTLFIRKDLIK